MTPETHMPHMFKARLAAVLPAIALALFFILPASGAHAAATSMFSASPSRIVLGESVTITWDSAAGFTCVGTNFSTGGATKGTVTVKPSSTGVKTYAINCSSSGNSFEEKDTVTVNSAQPPSGLSATITASPTTVTKGDSSLISWSSSGATTCRGANFSTGGATKGSVSVTPEKDTTYSVTCDGTTFSSTPGTWQYVGLDVTDLWCTQNPGKYSNFYTDNQCPGNSDPTGQSCTGSDTCAVNNWQTKQGGAGGNDKQYCNLVSDLYQCNGGGNAPSQVTDSVTVAVNQAPTAPSITGPASGEPETSYSFSFRATDPDGDTIRYRIDWDNNGSAEKVLPASGHVASNTLLDALRSWASIGTYTFRARTQDSHKALSGWASHTVAISGDGEPYEPDCSDGRDNDRDGFKDAEDPGCRPGGGGGGGGDSPGYDPNDNNEFESQCSDGIDNNDVNGTDLEDRACSSPFDDDEGLPPPAELSLSVSRLLVAPGFPITLTWVAANVKSDSCRLSGTNEQLWGPFSEGHGSQLSNPIVAETDFTLSCVGYNGDTISDSETVRLAPRYREK